MLNRFLDWMRGGEGPPEDEGEGPIAIRVEVGGKVYTRRYADLDMAQIRFPSFLAELNLLHAGARDGGPS